MPELLAIGEGLGGPELLVIGILALLLFGAKRLPELGRAAGRAMREFKRATSGVEENLREVMREHPTPALRPATRQVPPRTSAALPPAAASITPTLAAPDGHGTDSETPKRRDAKSAEEDELSS